jgi:hypothetical protein
MAISPAFVSGTKYDINNSWLEFASTSTLSKTVACISNVDRAFIIQVMGGTGKQVSSASIGGQALSRIGYIAYPSNLWMDVWGKLNAPTGNQTLSITLNASVSGWVNVLQFDKTSGWRTQITTAQGSTTNPSTTATSLIKDDLVISSIVKFNGLSGVGAGQTEIQYNYRYGLYSRPSTKILTVDGSTVFSYTSGASDKYAHVIWSLMPVPVGGGKVIWW